MASSNEYARKIFNSPTHAEPCLVHSAKQILLPENWCEYLPTERLELSSSLFFMYRTGYS